MISGGFDTTTKLPNADVALGIENRPTENGWRASVYANGVDNQLKVYVRCLEGDSSNG